MMTHAQTEFSEEGSVDLPGRSLAAHDSETVSTFNALGRRCLTVIRCT